MYDVIREVTARRISWGSYIEFPCHPGETTKFSIVPCDIYIARGLEKPMSL